jgi:voltage-gated potassium channel
MSLDYKEKIYEIIFEADTPIGKAFDVGLLIVIVASVATVMLESINPMQQRFGNLFFIMEWIFTILFTIEYILRLYCVHKPWKYAKSFFGVIDLLATLPTYLSLFIMGTQYLIVIRALRLLRIFRIFKLANFTREGNFILIALRKSLYKITVFLFFVVMLATIIGSILYLVEGDLDSGFTSIPRSVYWAIVTITTVGYGDISPTSELGQFLAALVMLLGYAIIAVPTGIVSAEIIKGKQYNRIACHGCGDEGHDDDARFCKYCGDNLHRKGGSHFIQPSRHL